MTLLTVQKRLTKAFIASDPTKLVLKPRKKTNDGAGGLKKTVQSDRAEQTFALVEPGNSGFQEPIVTDSGEQYTVQYMILGEVDSVFEKDDVFVFDGNEFKIVAIMPFNEYERRGVVIRHGW